MRRAGRLHRIAASLRPSHRLLHAHAPAFMQPRPRAVRRAGQCQYLHLLAQRDRESGPDGSVRPCGRRARGLRWQQQRWRRRPPAPAGHAAGGTATASRRHLPCQRHCRGAAGQRTGAAEQCGRRLASRSRRRCPLRCSRGRRRKVCSDGEGPADGSRPDLHRQQRQRHRDGRGDCRCRRGVFGQQLQGRWRRHGPAGRRTRLAEQRSRRPGHFGRRHL
jgi:hypothetical protein